MPHLAHSGSQSAAYLAQRIRAGKLLKQHFHQLFPTLKSFSAFFSFKLNDRSGKICSIYQRKNLCKQA